MSQQNIRISGNKHKKTQKKQKENILVGNIFYFVYTYTHTIYFNFFLNYSKKTNNKNMKFKHPATVALAVAIIAMAIAAFTTIGYKMYNKPTKCAETTITTNEHGSRSMLASQAMSPKQQEIYNRYNTTCSNQGDCHEEWVCLEGRCTACAVQGDCNGFFSPSYLCEPTKYERADGTPVELNTCVRKDLFPHISMWDIIATIGCFFGGSLAASAGIGGGGIYVPILMVTRFPPTMAVALSTACIFGTAISNFIILALRQHPERKRPLINYSAALIFEPIILSGTTLGVLLNYMLPNFATVIVLILMLVIVTVRTFWKGIKTVRKENAQRAAAKKDASAIEEHLETVTDDMKDIKVTMDHDTSDPDITNYESTREYSIWNFFESFRFPVWKIALITIAWIVLIVSSLLKGNKDIAGITKCSWPWWSLVAGSFVILFSLSMIMGVTYNVIYRRKTTISYPTAEGDIKWNLRNSFLLPALFLSAGLVAGLLGIGGGMIVGPLLLELGVIPEVSMATSAFMILFTSSATMVQFIIIGSVPLYYALWFVSFGIASAVLGQLVIGFLVKKSGRSSFIIFIIAISIGLATILTVGVGTFNIVSDFINKTNLSFTSPCE